jgi:PIN domain nuclease of toxin-antitoxin system
VPVASSQILLDASAFLAYLGDEPGAEVVGDAVATGSAISTVNLAEVLSTLTAHDVEPISFLQELSDRHLLGGAIKVEPFTAADAAETARLRPLTRTAGLSLGDRACLAVARRLNTNVLTADGAWSTLDIGIDVVVIR